MSPCPAPLGCLAAMALPHFPRRARELLHCRLHMLCQKSASPSLSLSASCPGMGDKGTPSRQFVPRSQFSVLSSQFSVPTQYSVLLSAWSSVPNRSICSGAWTFRPMEAPGCGPRLAPQPCFLLVWRLPSTPGLERTNHWHCQWLPNGGRRDRGATAGSK